MSTPLCFVMKKSTIKKYQHTQIGYLIIFVLLAVVLLFGFVLIQADFEPFVFIIMLFVLFILTSFASLKVTIDENYLRIKFGYGIFWKKFALKEIISAKSVRNHWYFGWGIRFWFWPYMIIFNVSGFDAVEIRMKNGKIYRIGTDDEKGLESAINREI
ncbi:MAG: hypothetical protein QGH85_02225 [Candidatus Pacebacteria bacterium]|nr:hypothetical protein [Candidatus Paceibacterota bacterium]